MNNKEGLESKKKHLSKLVDLQSQRIGKLFKIGWITILLNGISILLLKPFLSSFSILSDVLITIGLELVILVIPFSYYKKNKKKMVNIADKIQTLQNEINEYEKEQDKKINITNSKTKQTSKNYDKIVIDDFFNHLNKEELIELKDKIGLIENETKESNKVLIKK